MSAYLTNLVSRSVGKAAIQPRLSSLFGPATTGPEWTLGNRGQQEVEEEVRFETRLNPVPEPGAPELSSSRARESVSLENRVSSDGTPQVESSVIGVQASAEKVPVRPSAGPALRLTAERPRRPVLHEPSPEPYFQPRTEVPARDKISIGRENTSSTQAKAPARTEGVSHPVQANRTVQARPVEAQRDICPSHPTTSRTESLNQARQDVTVAERPRQQSEGPLNRSMPKLGADDQPGQRPREQLSKLIPDLEKPLERRALETPVPPPLARPLLGRTEFANHLPQIAATEPTIAVTIGRIEVRAITPPQPVKSMPPVTPVMSLDEYLRRRSGRR